MRIAYLCADLGIPIRGHKGASVHVREMVGALASQGHDVCVLTPNPGNGNPTAVPVCAVENQGLPVALTGIIERLAHHQRAGTEAGELMCNLALYRQAGALCRSWQPDVIYERYSLFNFSGLVLARKLGVPHLLEVNAPLRLERARTKGLALGRLARMVERSVLANSDAVFVVSAALRAYVLSRGAKAARTRVLPNGVDTARFHPNAAGEKARARWGLSSNAFVVGFAGSLKPWHGVHTLLDAFAILRQQEHSARLLIIGEGPCESALAAQARRLGLDRSVIFTGKAPHAEMPALLAALDVAVAPYLDVPDFYFSPLKIYEYMAAGRAVVASDVGEISALLHMEQTGILCPAGDASRLADALALLAADPAHRARLGTAARAEVMQHTWERNARTVADTASALSRTRRRSLRASRARGLVRGCVGETR